MKCVQPGCGGESTGHSNLCPDHDPLTLKERAELEPLIDRRCRIMQALSLSLIAPFVREGSDWQQGDKIKHELVWQERELLNLLYRERMLQVVGSRSQPAEAGKGDDEPEMPRGV